VLRLVWEGQEQLQHELLVAKSEQERAQALPQVQAQARKEVVWWE